MGSDPVAPLHVMVNDVVAAKRTRIPEKQSERRHVAGMERRAVRAHGADVVNPPIMDSDLQIDENNFVIRFQFLFHETTT